MEHYEFTENQIKISVTERLKHYNGTATVFAIYSLLNLKRTGFQRLLCNPVFDPYGTGIDQFTSEDEAIIQRIKAEKSNLGSLD